MKKCIQNGGCNFCNTQKLAGIRSLGNSGCCLHYDTLFEKYKFLFKILCFAICKNIENCKKIYGSMVQQNFSAGLPQRVQCQLRQEVECIFAIFQQGPLYV